MFFTVIQPGQAVPATDKPTVQLASNTTDSSAQVSADTEDGNTLPDTSDDSTDDSTSDDSTDDST